MDVLPGDNKENGERWRGIPEVRSYNGEKKLRQGNESATLGLNRKT